MIPREAVIHDMGQAGLSESTRLARIPFLELLSEQSGILVEFIVSESGVDRPRHGNTRMFDEV